MAAPISGTFLAPGVSKNGRLYTAEAIAKAVTRMQQRISDPAALPITMRTHHAAEDDSTKIAAYVTGVALQADGSATWEASPVENTAGRDIAAATQPGPDGKRPLAAVSIRGWWAGLVKSVTHEGRTVETADDIEIDGIDFTASPGVDAARITTYARAAAESHGQSHPITESTQATVSDTIDADEAYITIGGSANGYDSDVRVSTYTGDDDDLAAAATVAGQAAQAALDLLNAEPADGESDTAVGACAVCASTMPLGANYCPACGAATESAPNGGPPVTEHKEQHMTQAKPKATAAETAEPVAEAVAPVVEAVVPTTEAAPVAEAFTLTEAALTAQVTEAVRASTPAIIESLAATMGTKIGEAVDAIRKEIVASYGPPPRKGLVAASETVEVTDYSKMTDEQFLSAQTAAWDAVLPAPRF